MVKVYLLIGPLLCVFLLACDKSPSDIRYTATGTGPSITVTFIDGTGMTEVYNGVSPWNYSFTAKSGAELSVTGGSGSVGTSEVHIFVNGKDKAQDTETGLNATARTTVP